MWKTVFLACLALASAAPQHSELKRRAMEEAVDELKYLMERREVVGDFIRDEPASGTDEIGDDQRRIDEQAWRVAHEANLAEKETSAPNVFFFLIDDMGYNDIGWNNPDIISPRIDSLAHSGIIIDNSYAQAVCSPSRGAFMTGKYPMHTGMQHDVIMYTSPECGPADEQYLPEKLRDLGYVNHAIGKWHLGFCREECTPPHRGFDTFYGFYQGYVSHYSHEVGAADEMGYDWHDQEGNDLSANGTYSSELITARAVELILNHDHSQPMFMYLAHSAVHTPMEVAQQYKDLYPEFASNPTRQTFMGMVSELDHSIYQIVSAIREAGLYENSIIIFQSDNGGEAFHGNNAPFRGAKATVYEGGTRVPAFMHSPLSSASGVVSNELFHITDWHATILALAGGDPSGLDGVDQSQFLMTGSGSQREEILYTLDEVFPQFLGTAAIRIHGYKLIKGYPGIWDGWDGDNNLGLTHELDLLRNGSSSMRSSYDFDYAAMAVYIAEVPDIYQLYDLYVDPEERVNLASSRPDVVAILEERLDAFRATIHEVDLSVQAADPAGNPSNFGGFWQPGWC